MFVWEFYVFQHSASREQLGTSGAADTTSLPVAPALLIPSSYQPIQIEN
jgi:hypothetical protein